MLESKMRAIVDPQDDRLSPGRKPPFRAKGRVVC